MHLEMRSSTTFQVRIYGNEERKCMYGVDWVSNVSLFGDQRYFCTIGKYFPWWKQKCLEIVFQTFFSATKDISNLFTLFYIMILVFVRSLHSQPVRQWGLWWIEMGLDTLTQEDGRSWFFWLNLNGFMHSPLLFFTQLFPDKNPPWQFERTSNITKLVNEGRNWEVEIWLRLLWPSFNLNQSLRYGNP